jgi:hypothetical protein
VTPQLPDGWGPGTPRDDSLLRAYAEAYADLATDLGAAAGWCTHRSAAWAGTDSHEPFPFLNVAVLLRPVRDADDPVLDEISEFFAPADAGTPFLVWSATPTPDLGARGWSLMGHPPLMLRSPAAVEPPRPDGLEIVRVRDRQSLAAFETTMIEAYPVPEMTGRHVFADGVLDAPGWQMWLGVVDDRPVATAAAHVTDAFVDVEWISTRESHRGRRIGEAITWAATLAVADRPAMLFASDLGQPVYERMGYVKLARLTLWVGRRG